MNCTEPLWSNGIVRLYNADCRDMSFLTDESVDCCVTSPPYWGLRDYKLEPLIWDATPGCEHVWGNVRIVKRGHPGNQSTLVGTQTAEISKAAGNQGAFCSLCGAWRGSLGLEPTPERYIQHLVGIFREVRRVLKATGVAWVNMGDSYAATHAGMSTFNGGRAGYGEGGRGLEKLPAGLKPLDMVGIPWRLAFALQADGWWLRSDVIWHKLNPMPESVGSWRWERHRVKVKGRDPRQQRSKVAQQDDVGNSWPDNSGGVFLQNAEYQNCPGCPKCQAHGGLVLRKGSWRCTSSFEHIFMLAKSPQYWANAEAVREAAARPGDIQTFGGAKARNGVIDESDPRYRNGSEQWGRTIQSGLNGRNLRDVWQFPTQPYSGAHFATFPEALVEPCILASTSEYGNCPKCGVPWSPAVETEQRTLQREPAHQPGNTPTKIDSTGWQSGNPTISSWQPSCDCPWGAGCEPGLVMDPFGGSGTVGVVAQKLGRRAVLVELSSEYCELAKVRLEKEPMSLVGARP
jgi:DNA modification methylase